MTSQVCHLCQSGSNASTGPSFPLNIFSWLSMCVALGLFQGEVSLAGTQREMRARLVQDLNVLWHPRMLSSPLHWLTQNINTRTWKHMCSCKHARTHFSCQLQFNHFIQALHCLSNQAYLSISFSISFLHLEEISILCVCSPLVSLLWGSTVCTSWFCFHSDRDRTFPLQWWILN